MANILNELSEKVIAKNCKVIAISVFKWTSLRYKIKVVESQIGLTAYFLNQNFSFHTPFG